MKKILIGLLLATALVSGCINPDNPSEDPIFGLAKGFFFGIVEQAAADIDNSYCEFYSEEGDFTKLWAKGENVKMMIQPYDPEFEAAYILVRGNENWAWDPVEGIGTHTTYMYDLKDMPMAAMMKVMALDAVQNNRGTCTDNVVTDSEFVLPTGIQWEEGESDKDLFKEAMEEESWE